MTTCPECHHPLADHRAPDWHPCPSRVRPDPDPPCAACGHRQTSHAPNVHTGEYTCVAITTRRPHDGRPLFCMCVAYRPKSTAGQ